MVAIKMEKLEGALGFAKGAAVVVTTFLSTSIFFLAVVPIFCTYHSSTSCNAIVGYSTSKEAMFLLSNLILVLVLVDKSQLSSRPELPAVAEGSNKGGHPGHDSGLGFSSDHCSAVVVEQGSMGGELEQEQQYLEEEEEEEEEGYVSVEGEEEEEEEDEEGCESVEELNKKCDEFIANFKKCMRRETLPYWVVAN